MPEFGIQPEELQRLAQLVEENNLSELRYEEGDLRITLRTATYRSAFGAVAAAVVSPGVPQAVAPSEADFDPALISPPNAARARTAEASNLQRVEAPIMGVFYRSSAPGEPSFVDIGDTVEVGQVIGVIEAMKVFSEVPSDHAGRVAEIPTKNGALVQPGDPLIVLEAF